MSLFWLEMHLPNSLWAAFLPISSNGFPGFPLQIICSLTFYIFVYPLYFICWFVLEGSRFKSLLFPKSIFQKQFQKVYFFQGVFPQHIAHIDFWGEFSQVLGGILYYKVFLFFCSFRWSEVPFLRKEYSSKIYFSKLWYAGKDGNPAGLQIGVVLWGSSPCKYVNAPSIRHQQATSSALGHKISSRGRTLPS